MGGEKEEKNTGDTGYYLFPTVEDLSNVVDWPSEGNVPTYRLRRAAYHWAIAYVFTQCKVEIGDDKSLLRAVIEAEDKYVLPVIDNLEWQYREGGEIAQKLENISRTARSKAEKIELYNDYINRITKDVAGRTIQKAIKEGHLTALPKYRNSERQGEFYYGATGSGKSEQAAKKAATIFNGDVSILEIDRIMWLLYGEPTDDIVRIAGPEARDVLAKCIEIVQDDIKAGECPTVFFGFAKPLKPETIETLLTGGAKVSIHILTLPVEEAIRRAEQRAREPTLYSKTNLGRRYSEQEIRELHQEVSAQITPLILNSIGKNLEIEILDNNVPEGSPPRRLAYCDLNAPEPTITIYDNSILTLPSSESLTQHMEVKIAENTVSKRLTQIQRDLKQSGVAPAPEGPDNTHRLSKRRSRHEGPS